MTQATIETLRDAWLASHTATQCPTRYADGCNGADDLADYVDGEED